MPVIYDWQRFSVLSSGQQKTLALSDDLKSCPSKCLSPLVISCMLALIEEEDLTSLVLVQGEREKGASSKTFSKES